MYRYEYVSLTTGGGFFLDNAVCSHRQIIDQRAAEGWRFAGVVPVEFTSNGGMKVIDLIFEKEEEGPGNEPEK